MERRSLNYFPHPFCKKNPQKGYIILTLFLFKRQSEKTEKFITLQNIYVFPLKFLMGLPGRALN